MKLTMILWIAALVNVSAATGYGQKISLNAKNVSLEQIFEEITLQSGYNFVYTAQMLKQAKPLTISVKNRPLTEVLELCLKDQVLTYTISSRVIVIKRKPLTFASQEQQNSLAFVSGNSAENILSVSGNSVEAVRAAEMQINPSIKGKVTDSKGITIPGASVKLEGTMSKATSTDLNGNYSLTDLREGNYTLTISFLGFVSSTSTITLATGQQNVTNVSLKEGQSDLEEVVVVGYATQKKTSVTASVATIQAKEIEKLPITNISQALGGRVSGLVTRQGSGEPGNDAANIYIRGVATIGNSNPLLIVDGIPGRGFNSLDPNTIETITVLKDAAAAAPYGVAGANGVILVTTKQGKAGMPTLTFNSSYGLQSPTVLPEFPTGYEFALLKNAAATNAGAAAVFTPAELQKLQDGSEPDRYANTNGIDLIERNTPLVNNNIQLSGGAERIKYYLGAGYMYQSGIFTITNTNRFNLNLNLDADITKTTTLSLKVNGRQQKNAYSPIGTNRVFEQLKYALPNVPMFFSNGEPATYLWPSIYGSGLNTNKQTQIFTQLSLDQKLSFIPGLSAKVTAAYDPTTTFTKIWRTPTHVWTADYTKTPYVFKDAIFEQTKASLTQSVNQGQQLTYQTGLTYNQGFGKHNVGVLALFESRAGQNLNFSGTRNNYNLEVDELSLGSSNQADISNTGLSFENRQMGLVYQVTYDFAGKYLFGASGRYDGHYYFAPGKRFGFFPAFSAGWRLSEESFIKDNFSWIDNLKIKGSYGELGNLAGDPFQYLSSYTIRGNAYAIDGTVVQAANERAEANTAITWERAKVTNIGLEASLWRDRLTLEAEYFMQKRSNMLVTPDVVVPVEYGIGLSQVNAGKMQNKGFDLTLGTMHNFSQKLQVGLRINATYTENKLLQVFETAATYNSFEGNRRQTGRPLGTQFGYKALGYFQPSDFTSTGALIPGIPVPPVGASTKVFPGDLRYQDTDGNGVINISDYVPIGKPAIPLLLYGFNPSVRYKGISLDMLFQGTGNREFYTGSWGTQPFSTGRGANRNNLDYWTISNPDARFPRITPSPAANNTQQSSWWMNDAKYLRLKNVQLGFALPAGVLEKIAIQSAALTLSGQNLLTWTDMVYYDPETGSDTIGYPLQRTVSLGLNVTFK